jgi:hypothetical protein
MKLEPGINKDNLILVISSYPGTKQEIADLPVPFYTNSETMEKLYNGALN